MQAPLSTYRVQMHAGFGFDAVTDIAEYLHALGISHLYASPYLQACKGSTHGYDVLDHSRVNEELGGTIAHMRMCETLGQHQLGQVLDIVPNHMSISDRDNRWWWDVLENGPSSRYAAFFDVDWHAPEAKLHSTVLLPILGDHFGRILEAGEIQIRRSGGTFTFHYHDHVTPVAPRSLNDLLGEAAQRVGSDELAFIADSFANLPMSTNTDRPSVTLRHRDKEVLRRLLARLCAERTEVATSIDEVLAELNASPDALGTLLERQNYRLAFWRTAGQELDYRRFFDINSLVSLHMEDERVFHETHGLVLEWVRQGVLDGLRIDHPDGLRNPAQYFKRIREAAPRTWLVIEKILEPGERLPPDWPVAGTTGYDFLNRVSGLFVDSAGEEPISDFYSRFTGESTDFAAMVRDKKHLVMRELFASDLNRLASLLVNVCEQHKRYRDYTRRELNSMLRETIACFPIYRTYVQAELGRISDADRRCIIDSVEAAKNNRPDIDAALFDFLADILQLRVRGDSETELVMRFQQCSGPVMAKGVEDTVFYNYNRLVALNEVGGDPGRFGISIEQFHKGCEETQSRWPHTMSATTTHDTKRSEDVRARIALISEIPDRWREAVERWSATNARSKREGMPDRNIEYLLYQILVGAWPLSIDRAIEYLRKVSREAKAYTSWTNPKSDYDEALEGFVKDVLSSQDFLDDLAEFVRPLIWPGRINSLSQTLIKLTAPGVPDIYQGNELWDLSLVDPDNRRPVDFELRKRLLEELSDASPERILERADEGLPKLWVTTRALHLRRRIPQAFGAGGTYKALTAGGPKQDHVVAFSRGGIALTVVPRLPLRLANEWEETTLELPPRVWRHELTGETFDGGPLPLARLFERFPVALLSSQNGAG